MAPITFPLKAEYDKANKTLAGLKKPYAVKEDQVQQIVEEPPNGDFGADPGTDDAKALEAVGTVGIPNGDLIEEAVTADGTSPAAV